MSNFEFDFAYDGAPFIPVRIISARTASGTSIEALIDSGSDLTIFDIDVARTLRLALDDQPTIQFRGVTGELLEAPMVQLELLPLFEPVLSVFVRVVFLPGMVATVGNLIGRDVLEYLDFALIHSTRVGYLGRTETLT